MMGNLPSALPWNFEHHTSFVIVCRTIKALYDRYKQHDTIALSPPDGFPKSISQLPRQLHLSSLSAWANF